MSNFIRPGRLALDSNGEPLVGAKLNFYEAGTTTPLDTYPTEANLLAGTSPNANPVVSLAGGLFPEIFLQTDQAYSVVYTTSADVTLDSWDNINAAQLTSASLVTRVAQIASSPLDQGAVGDGAADESAEVQAAIDAATKTVDLLGKTFLCTTPLTLKAGLCLQNGTLDFTGCSGTEYLIILGNNVDDIAQALDANVAYQDKTVAITGGNLTSADLVVITETSGAYVDDEPPGELISVKSYSDPTVTLKGTLRDNYSQSNGASLARITPVNDVTLRGLTLIGTTGASGSSSRVLSAKMAQRLHVENCVFDEIDILGAGIYLGGCSDVTIKDCEFKWTSSGSGISIQGASRKTTIDNCQFMSSDSTSRAILSDNANHDPATQSIPLGITRDVIVKHCSFEGEGVACSFDENTQAIEVRDNTVNSGASRAFRFNGIDVICRDNTIHQEDATDGILFSPHVPTQTDRKFYIHCLNNTIRGAAADITVTPAAWTSGGSNAGPLRTLRIEDNNLEGDILVTLGSDADSATINDARIVNNVGVNDITVTSGLAALTLDSLRISNNELQPPGIITVTGTTKNIAYAKVDKTTVINSTATRIINVSEVAVAVIAKNTLIGTASTTTEAIYMTVVSHGTVDGNEVHNGTDGSYLIHVEDAARLNVRKNNIYSLATGLGIRVDAGVTCTGVNVAGNTVVAGQGTIASKGVAVDIRTTANIVLSNIVINGNSLWMTSSNSTSAVAMVDGSSGSSTIQGVSIAGNVLEAETLVASQAGVDLLGNGTNDILGVSIAGNTFLTLGVGVSASNGDEISNSGNSFPGTTAGAGGGANVNLGLDEDPANATSGSPTTANGQLKVMVNGTIRYIQLYSASI